MEQVLNESITTGPRVSGQYTREEVSRHFTPEDCWIIIDEQVYDVSPYLSEHDGGMEVILEYGGLDASSAFHGKIHSDQAKKKLKSYWLGSL